MTIPASIAQGWWRKLADDCIAKLELYINDPDPTLNKNGPVFAAMSRAIGEYYGWTDSRIPGLLAPVFAVRSPFGGYGLGVAYNGNPADAIYAITTSCFVGPHIAAAYDHGLVAQSDFDALLDCVRNWPTFTYSGVPWALPDYSATATGGTTVEHTKERVWNIVAAMATFLLYNRTKHSVVAAQTDCLNKGVDWKDSIKWSMNKAVNFGGWGYQGVNRTVRQDGSHNWLCATMSPWLDGGAAPLRTQMTAGYTPGDAAPTAGTSESNYMAGALALMSQHPEAFAPAGTPTGQYSFADQLIGRAAAAIAANDASTDPGGWAVNAIMFTLIDRIGNTL